MTSKPSTKPDEPGAREIDTDAWTYPHSCPRCQFPFNCQITIKNKRKKKTAVEPSNDSE